MNNLNLLRNIILATSLTITAFNMLASGQEPKSKADAGRAASVGQPSLMVQVGHSTSVDFVVFSPNGEYVLTGGFGGSAGLWNVETGKEIRKFVGDSGGLMGVGFSPSGKFVVMGNGRILKIWDVETGREIQTFQKVLSVDFTRDDRYVVTGGEDKTARMWDVNTGKAIHKFVGHSNRVSSVLLSPDEKFVLTGSYDHTARMWEVKTGKVIRKFQGLSTGVLSGWFFPSGKHIVTISEDKTARMWEVKTGKMIRQFEGRVDHLQSVSASSNGKYVLSGGEDKTARLWDVETGKEIQEFQDSGPVVFSPDNKYVLTISEDNVARLKDVETGKEIQKFQGHSNLIVSVVFSQDGKFLLTGGWDNTARLWDVKTGKEIQRFQGLSNGVFSVAYSPNGKYAMTSFDNTARIWDLETGREIPRLEGHTKFVLSVAFSPDSRYALTGSEDETARMWDVETGKAIHKFVGHSSHVSSVRFSPDGKSVLTGSYDHTARLWDVETEKEIQRFKGHSHVINAVAFSPDGEYVLTGSMDELAGNTDATARMWDIKTGKEIHRLNAGVVQAVAFSPDRRFILTGELLDGTVQLWDVKTGQKVRNIKTGSVWEISFSPDGKCILTSFGNTAQMWDVETGKEIRRFEGHTDVIHSAVFSPDGNYALTGGFDSTTRLWDVKTGKEICKLISFRDGNWVVVAPDGRFDASTLDDIKGLHWIMPDDPMRLLSLEIFMKDYYEPRLLPRLLDDIPDNDQFKPIRSLTSLNRVQPDVKIVDAHLLKDSSDTALVTVEVSKAMAERKRGNRELDETGVFDLRLFRDRQLVGYWPPPKAQLQQVSFTDNSTSEQRADQQLQSWRQDAEVQLVNGKFTKTFTVKLPHKQDLKEVTFTAYAFNRDRVRSRLTTATLPIATPLPDRKGRAYVISVGVNLSQIIDDPNYNLKYAAADAEDTSRQLSESLKQTGDYADVIKIKLVSDEQVKTATKANFKAVLDALAGKIPVDELKRLIPNVENLIPDINKLSKASPDDLVIISFSSHGITDKGDFFIYPYDTGDKPEQLLKRCISSEELSLWMMDIDAGDMLMVIDACHSGAATGEEFKAGPMDSRGLGQLAYDKGMKILAATQPDSNAVEVPEIKAGGKVIRGGLLTYVLIDEAIKQKLAVSKEGNLITAKSWMEYAVAEVPKIYEEVKKAVENQSKEKDKLQTTAKGTIRRVELKDDGRRELTLIFKDRGDKNQASKSQRPALFDFTKKRQEVVLARF